MSDQPAPAPLPTLADFWARCARHNYSYLLLDDPHALRRAGAVDAELRDIAARSKEHRDIFWGFYDAAHVRGAKRPARPDDAKQSRAKADAEAVPQEVGNVESASRPVAGRSATERRKTMGVTAGETAPVSRLRRANVAKAGAR
jgi:hypothetical protein